MPMRLVQLRRGKDRSVAIVEEPRLRLLGACSSIYDLAQSAIQKQKTPAELVSEVASQETLDYDPVYAGSSEWRLQPAIDHPSEPARCVVSGTGLTHMGSARNRQSMHATPEDLLTDSMKMFRWGVEGGKPRDGEIGTSPEWFHKGNGYHVRAHGEPLDVPSFALDGGEEAELAGIYVISSVGVPYRIGMAAGNEFSDHVFEKKNYLYLASSKLRSCSVGPELVVDPDFSSVPARVAVERGGKQIWTREFRSGEAEMCHSLANIEHHHFKFDVHRHPGDVHIHFFGTAALSFNDDVRLENGDVMQVAFEGYGRPLRNPVRISKKQQELIRVNSL
jgi:hypothetical protein